MGLVKEQYYFLQLPPSDFTSEAGFGVLQVQIYVICISPPFHPRSYFFLFLRSLSTGPESLERPRGSAGDISSDGVPAVKKDGQLNREKRNTSWPPFTVFSFKREFLYRYFSPCGENHRLEIAEKNLFGQHPCCSFQ